MTQRARLSVRRYLHADRQRSHARGVLLRGWVITALAAASAWALAEALTANIEAFNVPPLVAAITALLTVRVSLHRASGEAGAQLLGTLIGAGLALVIDNIPLPAAAQAGIVVLGALAVVKALKLGDEAGLSVPITALIVLGPGLHEATAADRLAATVVGVSLAVFFSFVMHPDSPAGRAAAQVAQLSDGAASLLADISQGLERRLEVADALDWLERARALNEAVPTTRAACDEAVAYARWFPKASQAEASAVYARFLAAEHVVVTVRAITRSLVELAERDIELGRSAHEVLAEALETAAHAAEVHAATLDDGVELALRVPLEGEGMPLAEGVPDNLAESVETLRERADDVIREAEMTAHASEEARDASALTTSVAVSLRRIGDSLLMDTHAIKSAPVDPEKSPATVAMGRITHSVLVPARATRQALGARRGRRRRQRAKEAARR